MLPAQIYQNFSLNNSALTLSVVIWGMYAGLMIASVAAVYNKLYLGKAIRSLIKNGCNSPENACVLEETGVKPSAAMRRNLRDGKLLRRYIEIANPEECLRAEKKKSFFSVIRRFFSGSPEAAAAYELSTARLYVPEDKRIQAELRYEKKGSSPWLLLVAAVLLTALAVGLYICIPELLSLADSMITMYKNL